MTRIRLTDSVMLAVLCGLSVAMTPAHEEPGRQARESGAPRLPPPEHANVEYGPHQRNVFDLWSAESDQPARLVIYPHGARARTTDQREPLDNAAVSQLWSTVDAMWTARDAQRFSDLFTLDGSVQFVDRGESLEGRATIRQHFAERFSQFAPDLRHLTSVHEIRAIAPDVRTVDAKVEILQHDSTERTEPAVLRTFAVVAVMLRADDDWKIRVLRAYELPAETGNAAGH